MKTRTASPLAMLAFAIALGSVSEGNANPLKSQADSGTGGNDGTPSYRAMKPIRRWHNPGNPP